VIALLSLPSAPTDGFPIAVIGIDATIHDGVVDCGHDLIGAISGATLAARKLHGNSSVYTNRSTP
jgi:hypothetical protein